MSYNNNVYKLICENMADLNKKEVVSDWQEQQSGLLDRSKVKLAAAVLAVGLSTSVQASDLLNNVLKQCDGIDRQWLIQKDKKNWIIDWFAEKKCEKEVQLAKGKEESARLDKELAKGKEELAKLKEEDKNFNHILAMLDKDELKKALLLEVKKTEDELKKEKDKTKREKLLIRLDILKWKLKELDKNVA